MVGNQISPGRLADLLVLIDAGDECKFYSWPEWRSTREAVLRLDRNECQACKRKGRYRKGKIVHHVRHLKDRPDLALSIYDPDTGHRQLETLCKQCHEAEHPESKRQYAVQTKPLTEERWD